MLLNKKKTLQVKVFMVKWLIRLKLLPAVWYQCELDLIEIEVKELQKIFNWD